MMPELFNFLLIFGTGFLVFITLVFFRNYFQFRELRTYSDHQPDKDQKPLKAALCIPARNEENVIGRCLRHALAQSWEHLHVYVLNDRSTDKTGVILSEFENKYPVKLTVIQGSERPDGFLGKTWACRQLAERADSADILIFMDADTWAAPDAVTNLISAFQESGKDFITVWPEQKTGTFWERVVVPQVYYALMGFLPAKYTERPPRWMPDFLAKKNRGMFAAACGQCMAFRREAYEAIGGHDAVKAEIVEDVELARRILTHGFTMMMLSGTGSFFCRMYENHEALFSGFRKNFLAGFRYNIPLFLLMAAAHFSAYLLPPLLLITALFTGTDQIGEIALMLSILATVLTIFHRIILVKWFRFSLFGALLYPVGVAWFQVLGIVVLLDRILGKKVNWKGEKV